MAHAEYWKNVELYLMRNQLPDTAISVTGWNGEGSERKWVGSAMAMGDGWHGDGPDGKEFVANCYASAVAWLKDHGATHLEGTRRFQVPV